MAEKFTSFTDSFIKGYSFIDSINARRRQEEKLDQRLEEESKARVYQRSRQDRIDAERTEDRALKAEDRQNMIKGEELAASGASPEELVPYVAFSPSAANIVKEARRRGELAEAAETLGTIGNAPTQSVAGGFGPQLGGQAPVTESPVTSLEDTQLPSGEGTAFAPARTPDTSLQTLSEESVQRFQPDYQERGLGGKLLADFAGNIQQGTRMLGNLAESLPVGGPAGGNAQRGPRAAGTAFAGEIFVPSEFIDPQSEAYLSASPRERAEIERANTEIVEDLEKRAMNPARNKLARPITLQGRLQEGGELLRDEIQAYNVRVKSSYSKFINGDADSELEALARQNPAAAAQKYFQDRNTVGEIMGKEAMDAVDGRMLPVLDEYAAELVGTVQSLPAGTSEQKRFQDQLRQVQTARAEISRTGTQPAERAGVNPGGMPVGNRTLTDNVMQVVDDPSRPRAPYGTTTEGQTRAAMTVAQRVTGRSKLTRKQIDAMVLLRDEQIIDPETVRSVLMTGHWPPGKDPNAVTKITTVNGYAVAFTEGGGFHVVPGLSNPDKPKGDTGKPGEGTSRSFDSATLDVILNGARTVTPNMQPYQEAALKGFMLDFAPVIRQRMNTASEENKMMIGRIVQQSLFLSEQSQNDGFLGMGGKKDVTPEELFFSQDMRVEYAKEFDQRPVQIPERVFQQQYDAEAIRSELIDSGVLSEYYTPEQIGQLGERDLIYIANVLFADVETFGEE